MATAAKLTPRRRHRAIPHRRHATLHVHTTLSLRTIDVDGISPTDSATLPPGDAVLWHSPSGALFKISGMTKRHGPGPAQPFQKHFPNNDPWATQVYSGLALPNNGASEYKYTVSLKNGPKIDPEVVIEE